LDAQTIKAVQQSFEAMLLDADTFTDLFYSRLFALEPSLRDLFLHDLLEQKAKLLAMLKVIVQGLDRPDMLLPAVRELGARHAGYGVRTHHYDLVEAALLWSLEVTLAEQFTPAANQAWQQTYTWLAQTMQSQAVAGAELARTTDSHL
jgi:hemoglobin-like flavoprotein